MSICYLLDGEMPPARQNGKSLPCVRLQAENDKLREQNRYLMKGDLLHVLTDQELAEQQRREREMQASIKALDAENAKLREELAKWERLTAGINLPDYPVSQFVPKDLERENAKLRELGVEV